MVSTTVVRRYSQGPKFGGALILEAGARACQGRAGSWAPMSDCVAASVSYPLNCISVESCHGG